MKDSKIPLLLFSGGADSTARLFELLNVTPVDILYVEGHQHPDKVKMELRARERILKTIQSESLHNVRSEYRFPKIGPPDRSLDHFCFHQAPDWFVAALYTFDPLKHSRVEICYLLNDDISHVLDKLQMSWKSLVAAVKCGEYVDGLPEVCTTPLVFPYHRANKTAIYRYLTPTLREMIWVCEMPTKNGRGLPKPCGRCKACRTQKQTLDSINSF